MLKFTQIVAMCAGFVGVATSLAALAMGGMGVTSEGAAGSAIAGLGWVSLAMFSLAVVCGAINLRARTRASGAVIVVSATVGAAVGGPVVAGGMIIALLGGLLASIGTEATSAA